MSLTSTLQPSCAKRLAMPSPKPEPAPVTMATLFSNRMCSSDSFLEKLWERRPAANVRMLFRGEDAAPTGLAIRSIVLDHHRLQHRVSVQRFESFLAPVTAFLHAAERQLDA